MTNFDDTQGKDDLANPQSTSLIRRTPMTGASLVDPGTSGSTDPDFPPSRLTFLAIVALSAWGGVVAGLLEVALVVLRKRFFDADQIIKFTHHFHWFIPVANLGLFVALAAIGYPFVRIWPDRGRRLFTRALATFTLLPAILVAFPKIYAAALLLLAAGLATRIVPILERSRLRRHPVPLAGFFLPVAIVAFLAGTDWYRDHSKRVAENARPLPPPGSPNVLMVVLDTVAASHSSLNGYNRATTTTLSELAGRGLRFDCARATSSWTLPSHASMFTGQWLHDNPVGWLTPLDNQKPTIAEYLGSHGYATAGFIANVWFCAVGSGLSRGFAHYEDYIFPRLTALKTCVIGRRAIEFYQDAVSLNEDILKSVGCFDALEFIRESLANNRKDAAEVNGELLDWLSGRDQPDRPFFAFLNYFDAHYPYVIKPGRLRRFGAEPDDDYKRFLINHWWEIDKTKVSPSGVAFAADAYDDCIADLDEQIGKLIDTLERRGILENTWLIVVSDHGESFGEHPNIFGHGSTLFDTEVRVPLVIVPPTKLKRAIERPVGEPVSLRDIAATIVAMTGLTTGSPFPGDSLTRFRKNAMPDSEGGRPAILSELVPNDPDNRDYWGLPESLPPRASLKDSEWSYMRREVEVGEQLYHLTEDSREQRNLAQDPSFQETLRRLRASLDRWTKGPLLPGRFPP